MGLALTVLGGSPAWPNPGQAASGYLVESARARVLLDCGSGIASELRAHDPGPLTDIVISHFHADHWFDLVPLHYAYRYGSWSDRPRASLHLPPGGRSVLDRWRRCGTGRSRRSRPRWDVAEYDPSSTSASATCGFTFAPSLHYTTCYSIKIDAAGVDDRLLGRHGAHRAAGTLRTRRRPVPVRGRR